MLLFLFVDAFLLLFVLTGGGGGGGTGSDGGGGGDGETWNACMVLLSMDTSRLVAAAGATVLFMVAFADLEGDRGRRGQTRMVNVVCERRKTRKRSRRRKGREMEKKSSGNGFRGGAAIAGEKKSDVVRVLAGGVAMAFVPRTACTWNGRCGAAWKNQVLRGLPDVGREGAPSAWSSSC
jgi:hypothetical protein